MRHPPRYDTGLRYVFGFVVGLLHSSRWNETKTVLQTSVDIAMAIVGYLLYGEGVLDELTTSMIRTAGYPRSIKILVLILIAIVPITKFPLL